MPDDLTTRLVAAFEKAAKAVRGGILAASDNLAFLVSDACRTPNPAPAGYQTAGSVVAPSPKQGSDSPPTDCSIPPLPVGGHPTHELLRDAAQHLQYYIREFEQSITAQINGGGFIRKLLDRADVLDPPK